jgi:outer membrane protein assembly factor BamB
MNILRLSCLSLALLVNAHAENWAQWRGPAFNGSSPETGLPKAWSREKVKWATPLPGPSGATPAIWGDSIFVSSPDEEKNLLLLCIDRPTGKVRWTKKVVEGGNMDKGRGNSASPSPITDGKAVYILYSTGDFAAYDFAGQELWRRDLAKEYGRFSINWLYGSSPLLWDGVLYLQVLQRSPAPPDYPGIAGHEGPRESYLLAVDPKTGKNLWKHIRPSDAVVESQESYATPIPHIGPDGKKQLLIVGGDCLSGHDPKTGQELWRGFGLNRKKGPFMRLVPSPVSVDGLAIACGPKKEQMLAYRTDLKGDITEKGVAWSFDEKKTPDVCTPTVYDGKLFVLDGDSATLTCFKPKTGEKIWQGQLALAGTGKKPTVIRASPTAADGRIFIMDEKGTVTICSAGNEFKVLESIAMGDNEGSRASIAVSDKQLFIRTTQNLFCVGQ